MKVEIWSDVVCPWCAIGKRRFERALDLFGHRDDVEVVWRSFELDPAAQAERSGTLTEHLAAKYRTSHAEAQSMQDRMTQTAALEGLDFRFDRARPGNTFDAHRVLHLARERGVQAAVKERFLSAYLSEGEAIGDPVTLARLAGEAGLDESEVAEVLAGERYAVAVRSDEDLARSLGISGVPFFAVDRTYGVSGAQPADLLVEVLEKAWEASHPLTMVAAAPETACGDEGCAS
jgi:predicted DsbA family dithiol-disulfide isomerase